MQANPLAALVNHSDVDGQSHEFFAEHVAGGQSLGSRVFAQGPQQAYSRLRRVRLFKHQSLLGDELIEQTDGARGFIAGPPP